MTDATLAALEPIAIVGIGCRMPGGANDADGFWRILRDKVDATGPVPHDRWDLAAYHDPSGRRPGSITAGRGAFLTGIDQFDPAFFGISPREATRMDPQHRLLLEVAWEAMEDAGRIPSELAGTPVGVFVGISWNDYSAIQLAPGNADSIDAHTGTGGANSIAANRLSHAFDFRGPSVAIDTACSSALVAVHQACSALRNDECSLALAGGVNAMLIPAYFIALSRLNMLSAVGQCRAFDADGKGYVRGEGAGLVALRRLSDATRDGDRIYAVIRGSAVNQDGHTNGITVPSQASQEVVVRDACRRAGVRPQDIGYVEAHGTGTPVGDPIEAHALGSVIGQHRADGDVCYLGSVKTNVGHLESAAGIAGLLKATLALSHEQIPPNLHFDTPHPGIPFDRFHLRVATDIQPWPRGSVPRYAGVNSFGFGGTNAHVILGEAPASAAPLAAATTNGSAARILVVSARTPAALRAHVAAHAERLGEVTTPLALDETCRTAATRRDHLEHRLAVVAPTAAEMHVQLGRWLAGEQAPAVRSGRAVIDSPLAFAFCGQGPQWWGMARQLLATNDVFRATIHRIDALLRRDASWSLAEELSRDEGSSRVNETNILQPAIFAVQVGLVDVWRSWGVTPDAVVGHSMGEIAAAHAAGALSLESAVRVIYHRARIQHRTAGTGGMLAVGLSRAGGEELLAKFTGRAWIAGVNGPSAVTIGGEPSAIAEITATLAARGVFHRAVRIEMACHTPHMDGLEAELLDVLGDIEYSTPVIPFYSTVAGAPITSVLDAEYWWRNLREPVDFLGATEKLAAAGVTQFVEIGPHPVLASGIAEVMLQSGRMGTIVPSIRRGDDDATIMLLSLGALYAAGRRVSWKEVVGTGGDVARLPNYPWQRQRYWNESPRAQRERIGSQRKALLGARQHGADGCWESALDGVRYPFLAHHVVQETIIVPGAALSVLAMMAGEAELAGEGRVVVEEIAFAKPLFVPADGAQTLQLTVRGDGSVEINSRAEGRDESWTRNATARVRREPPTPAPPARDLDAIRARCTRTTATDDLYTELAAKGINLGEMFRGVVELHGGMHEALALIEAPSQLAGELDGYPLHPVLLDSCLQTFLTAMPTGHAGLHLPVEIGRFRLYERPASGRFWVHVVMKSWSDRTVEGDATLMDDRGNVLGEAAGCVVRVVQAAEHQADSRDNSLYQLQWHSAPAIVETDLSSIVPAPAALAAEQRESFAAAAAEDAAYDDYYDNVQQRLEALASRYVVDAMRSLGWKWREGEHIALAAHAQQLGVVPRHARLFERLAEMLADDGLLSRGASPREYTVARVPDASAANEDAARIAADVPFVAHEAALLARCGLGLARVLRGELDPMQLVFPDGDLSDVEHLNQDFVVTRAFNASAARMVARMVASLPADRAIRVLEIGGGTGALTKHVLPVLPASRTTYTHTDVSALFGRQAREKFAAYPFVTYELLDIEKDPSTQGFAAGAYDIVLAGNVLHATTDLHATTRHVRSMLAPGGVALVLEGTRLPRWIELIFGLTDGWWRFADSQRAGTLSPLLTPERWLATLAEAGFASADVVADPRRVGQPGHAVLVAQASSSAGKIAATRATSADGQRWLVLGDHAGIGRAVGETLRSRGADVTLVKRGELDAAGEIDSVLARAASGGAIDNVLFCWGVDAESGAQASVDALSDDLALGLESALHLVRAVVSSSAGGALPKIIFVTRDGQAVGAERPAVSQAPLWGFGRVVMSEHYDAHARLIDVSANAFDAGILADELLAGTEDEVALRGTRRFVRRLVPRSDLRNTPATTARAGESAFALRVATPGVLDTLEYRAVERAAPAAGEVEVEVHAAGLNFKDVMLAMGMLPDHALDASHGGWTLGREFAGTVTRVGDGVTNVAVGDDVLGLGSSAFGSFCTTFAGAVVRRPATLTAEQAAAIPLVFVTAHYALNTLAGMKAGDRVLIHSASGGVGLAAIQLAHRAGAEVFATAGTEEKRALVRSLGVRHVMDSRSLAFAEEIMEITGGEGVDIVLNTLPGQAIEKGLAVLRANGRFLEIGRRDIWQNSRIGLRHFTRNLTLIAIDVDRSGREQPEVVTRAFREVVDGFADGSLKPLPYTLYEPGDIASAFRLMAQSRHTGKLVVAFRDRPVTIAPSPVDDRPHVRANGTYLLTGGLGGFGVVVADWLVRSGARHLVLLGRSGASTPGARDAVARLEAAGASVRVVCADVTREADVAHVMADIAHDMPPLRGVMHMAMVLDDSFIAQLDTERMRRVVDPKILGAWNLHRATEGLSLDWFVMFSSGAAVFGNPGQSNYAAGNAFLPALAQLRRAQGLPGLSIDWGRLGGIGYVAQHDRVGEFLDRQGYPPIMPADALSAMGTLLRSDEPQASVMRVDWPRWRSFFPTTRPISARFAALAAAGLAHVPAGAAGEKHHGRAIVSALPAAEREERLVGFVAEHLARVLGTSAGSIDAEARLNDLGLDSLMAVELRNRFEREFGVDIPVMTLLQGPSVHEVAGTIGAALGGLVLSSAPSASDDAVRPVDAAVASPSASAAAHPVAPNAVDAIPLKLATPVATVPSGQNGATVSHTNGHASSWLRRRGPRLTSGALGMMARIDIQGLDHIPRTGPVVVAANHVNALDALLMFGYMPRRMSSFVKASLQHQPVVGWFVQEMLDAIWVERGAGDEAALAEAIAAVRGGGALAINPEGTRSRTGVLQKGQPGAAFIASQTGAPVVPLVAWGHERLGQGLRALSRPTITVRVGEPIHLPAATSSGELGRNTTRIMRAMADMLPEGYRGMYAGSE